MAVVKQFYIKEASNILAADGEDFSLKTAYGIGCPEKSFMEMAALSQMIKVMKSNSLSPTDTRDLVNNIIEEENCDCLAKNFLVSMPLLSVTSTLLTPVVYADYIVDIDTMEVSSNIYEPYVASEIVVSLTTEEITAELLEPIVVVPPSSMIHNADLEVITVTLHEPTVTT